MIKAAKGDATTVADRLLGFWHDMSTQNIIEAYLNQFWLSYTQLAGLGAMPELTLSPSHPLRKTMTDAGRTFFPRFYDFERLLNDYIDFDEIRAWGRIASPTLLVAAANVTKGTFKIFNSLKTEIEAKAILASAAVPTLFEAVQIGEDRYWDGLFSDNPPIDELMQHAVVGPQNVPHEIWIIQINPQKHPQVPDTPEEIIDRRNEMIGNESLQHDIETVKIFNRFIDFVDEKGTPELKQAFKERYHLDGKVFCYRVNMSADLMEGLDYSSKLNRDARHIKLLIEDGRKQGTDFLKSRGMPVN